MPIHRLVTKTRLSLRSNLVCSTRNNFKTFGHYLKELIHCCSRKLPTQKLVIYFNESSCKRACYCYLVLSWKSQARRLALLLPGNNEKVEEGGNNSISREKKTQKSRMNCKKRKLFVSRITCAMRECDTNHKHALKASSIQHQNLAHFSMYICNHYFEWNRQGSSEARYESV